MPWLDPQSAKLRMRRASARAVAYRDNPLRQCSRCRLYYPVLDKIGKPNFWKHQHASDGLRPNCRFCEYEADKPRLRARTIAFNKAFQKIERDRKIHPNMLRKRWWTKYDIMFHFKIGPKTFGWWRTGGMSFFHDIRFPKPMAMEKNPVTGKRPPAMWARNTIRWWEDLLVRRQKELRDLVAARRSNTPLQAEKNARDLRKESWAAFKKSPAYRGLRPRSTALPMPPTVRPGSPGRTGPGPESR